MLEIEDLHVYYGEIHALKGIAMGARVTGKIKSWLHGAGILTVVIIDLLRYWDGGRRAADPLWAAVIYWTFAAIALYSVVAGLDSLAGYLRDASRGGARSSSSRTLRVTVRVISSLVARIRSPTSCMIASAASGRFLMNSTKSSRSSASSRVERLAIALAERGAPSSSASSPK